MPGSFMSELILKEVSLKAADGEAIVSGVDLVVGSGASVSLIGESGAGKTSLALAVMGLWRGTLTGEVHFGDRRLDSLPAADYRRLRGRELVYMPQDPKAALDPTMTVGAALGEVLRLRGGLARGPARVSAVQWLERVGLSPGEETRRLYPHELSGGMAQRVIVAKALACGPTLLIADEPFSALDPLTAGAQVRLLEALRAELDFSLLLITHDLVLARELTDETVVLKQGRVVETGSVGNVLAQPRHAYTKELVAASGLWVKDGVNV